MGQYAEGQTAQELLNFLNSNVKRMSSAPALKDTIAIPSGGYAIIKFRANNPGKLSLSIHSNTEWWGISMLVSRVGCDSPLMLLLLWSSISSNRLNALFEGLGFHILKFRAGSSDLCISQSLILSGSFHFISSSSRLLVPSLPLRVPYGDRDVCCTPGGRNKWLTPCTRRFSQMWEIYT